MAGYSGGDAAQTRIIGEQIADVAIEKFAAQHPELRRGTVTAEIPPPLKWAAIIASSIVTVVASSGVVWLVSSVSNMSETLARMDERMAAFVDAQKTRLDQHEERITELEGYHKEGGR